MADQTIATISTPVLTVASMLALGLYAMRARAV